MGAGVCLATRALAQPAPVGNVSPQAVPFKTPSSLERYGVAEIVDAQLHVWPANTPETPWPTTGGSTPQKPYAVSAEMQIYQMDMAGVHRAYLIPPSWSGDSNAVAIDAAKRYPDRFKVIGRINLLDPRCAELMPTWKQQPGMIGFRCLLSRPDLLEAFNSGNLERLLAAAAEADVRLTMLAPSNPRAPEFIEKVVVAFPQLKVSVDHLNLGTHADLQEVLPGLLKLAKYPNLAVKASGTPSISQQAYPFRDLHDALHSVFDAFGPKRMFWGTDLTRSVCSYQDNITMFSEHLPWLKGEDRDWVMGRAATEWWGWPA